MIPDKVDIPERYISKDEEPTDLELQFQLKKSNSIKKILAAQRYTFQLTLKRTSINFFLQIIEYFHKHK